MPEEIEGYLHVDLATYRQGVLLRERYDTYAKLVKALFQNTPDRRQTIEDLYNQLDYINCHDIRALVPMLYNCEEEVFGYEEQFGALHILSQYVRPYDVTMQETHNTIDWYPISSSFKNEIQTITQTYELTCINYDELTNPGIIKERERHPIFVLGSDVNLKTMLNSSIASDDSAAEKKKEDVEKETPAAPEVELDPELEKMLSNYVTNNSDGSGKSSIAKESINEIIDDAESEYSDIFKDVYWKGE